MNRFLVLGIAMFFAVVGIALIGGENNTVLAGHGCHGCCDCSGDACCSKACSDSCSCHKRCGGLFSRCGGCHKARCSKPACCCPTPCSASAEKKGGEAPAPKAEEKKAPVAPKTSSINRGFRAVSFVR